MFFTDDFHFLSHSAGKIACLNIWSSTYSNFEDASSCEHADGYIYRLTLSMTLHGEAENATERHPEFNREMGN